MPLGYRASTTTSATSVLLATVRSSSIQRPDRIRQEDVHAAGANILLARLACALVVCSGTSRSPPPNYPIDFLPSAYLLVLLAVNNHIAPYVPNFGFTYDFSHSLRFLHGV
jgi:hypothetical protein